MNQMALTLLGALLLLLHETRCDLPVHCLARQIAGDWELILNSDKHENNLSCGHGMPDKNTDHVYTDSRMLPVKLRVRVRLKLPDEVYSVQKNANLGWPDITQTPGTPASPSKFLGRFEGQSREAEERAPTSMEEEQRVGTWTMIYDEGFEIRAFNKTFFAFSKYRLKDDTTPSDQDDEQTKGYLSVCNETFIGWYYDSETMRSWGCFYGVKEKDDEEVYPSGSQAQPELSEVLGDSLKFGKIVEKPSFSGSTDPLPLNREQLSSLKSEQLSLYQKFQRRLDLYEMPHSHFLSEHAQSDRIFQLDYSFVNTVNDEKANSPWKAKAHENFMNKTQKHMLNLLGLTKFKQIKLKQHAKALKKIEENRNLERSTSSEEEPRADILNEPNKFSNFLSFLQLKETAKLRLMERMKSLNKIRDKLEEPLTIDSNILQSDEKMEEFESKFMRFLEKSSEEPSDLGSRSSAKNPKDDAVSNFSKEDLGRAAAEAAREEQDEMVRSLERKVFGDIEEPGSKATTPCARSEKEGTPSCFDWRNRSNVNYDTYVRHQGECGSCYAVAALSSIESRIRIKSKNTKQPFLSTSGVLSCSRYNQGCNGGYPELVAKYGKEYGFFETSCSPEIDSDKFCESSCFKAKVWRIKDYGYVGKNYYGSTDEKKMMEEIYKNGPIVVALNASPDLYYYSSGVFITNPKEMVIQDNGHPQVNPWQFTNHAVVCVGWGEAMHEGDILKYWILKNSWGPQWGESGYFRILRGVNLAAVENQAVYADPIVD